MSGIRKNKHHSAVQPFSACIEDLGSSLKSPAFDLKNSSLCTYVIEHWDLPDSPLPVDLWAQHCFCWECPSFSDYASLWYSCVWLHLKLLILVFTLWCYLKFSPELNLSLIFTTKKPKWPWVNQLFSLLLPSKVQNIKSGSFINFLSWKAGVKIKKLYGHSRSSPPIPPQIFNHLILLGSPSNIVF